jgi:hypothetical protein
MNPPSSATFRSLKCSSRAAAGSSALLDLDRDDPVRRGGAADRPYRGLALRTHRDPAANKGFGSTLDNILWFVLGGWYLALLHLVTGVLLCVTLVGLPDRRSPHETGWTLAASQTMSPRGATVADQSTSAGAVRAPRLLLSGARARAVKLRRHAGGSIRRRSDSQISRRARAERPLRTQPRCEWGFLTAGLLPVSRGSAERSRSRRRPRHCRRRRPPLRRCDRGPADVRAR